MANYELPPLHEDGIRQNKEFARSKGSCLGRAQKNITVDIVGDPLVAAQMLLIVIGCRAEVDGIYRIKSAKHKLNNHGYETTINAEIPSVSGGGGSGGSVGGSGAGGGGGYGEPSP
jgi:hypothetical protein